MKILKTPNFTLFRIFLARRRECDYSVYSFKSMYGWIAVLQVNTYTHNNFSFDGIRMSAFGTFFSLPRMRRRKWNGRRKLKIVNKIITRFVRIRRTGTSALTWSKIVVYFQFVPNRIGSQLRNSQGFPNKYVNVNVTLLLNAHSKLHRNNRVSVSTRTKSLRKSYTLVFAYCLLMASALSQN